MKAKEIKNLLIALNSTNDFGFKYPIGNKELTVQVRQLESEGVLYYKAHESKWVHLTKRNVFFKGV